MGFVYNRGTGSRYRQAIGCTDNRVLTNILRGGGVNGIVVVVFWDKGSVAVFSSVELSCWLSGGENLIH